ncbi:MAG TPA: superoxide dismutase [Opitutus sp.]|nr:superoxide dismutase [Opitutus sp.]
MATSKLTAGISRRDALKTLGAGAALLGLGGLPFRGVAAESSGGTAMGRAAAGKTSQPFQLPKLGYSYGALEPHIDARTMEIHYAKHHQAYIDNANKALKDHPKLQSLSAEDILGDLNAVPESIRTTLRNNVGGHVNHTFFWKVIGPNGGGAPDAAVAGAIGKAFGSVDDFKKQFADAAMKRFGSGWAWLSVKNGALQVHSTANQDSPLSEGAIPLLGLDVWEHAYYLHYQNRRGDYVSAFWNVVNWKQVAENYRAAFA